MKISGIKAKVTQIVMTEGETSMKVEIQEEFRGKPHFMGESFFVPLAAGEFASSHVPKLGFDVEITIESVDAFGCKESQFPGLHPAVIEGEGK